MTSRGRCQCLRQIGNQVVGMLDADRQADRRVQHTDTVPYLGRNTRMCHGGGMARERLGTAEADRQLEDLQGIEESERLLLAALDVEGEGRARPRALPGIDRLCW